MSALAIMEKIGHNPEFAGQGTDFDREFYRMGRLLADQKDETFIEDVNKISYMSGATIEDRRIVLGHLGLAPIPADGLIEDALQYHRGATPDTPLGAGMIAICKDTCLPFYGRQVIDQVTMLHQAGEASSERGLSFAAQTGRAMLQATMYAELYYDEVL